MQKDNFNICSTKVYCKVNMVTILSSIEKKKFYSDISNAQFLTLIWPGMYALLLIF